MKICSIDNPFGAPVYYRETVSSTMDEARLLASRGEVHGAVIAAGFQEAGRGRGLERRWEAGRGENLLFTILLRYAGFGLVPGALTLRAGLAVSLAVEDFAPELKGRVLVKWPNDIMLLETRDSADTAFKTAGILAESVADASGCVVYIGVGVNLAQTEFPAAVRARAASLLLARQSLLPCGGKAVAYTGEDRFRLLEKILARLYREIAGTRPPGAWRARLEERLYRRGERVCFFPGGADTGQRVEGVLSGIGGDGELLVMADGETESRAFITGELDVYRDTARPDNYLDFNT
ncbi:MAG: biotin--[acetyl-CoA-carboxylase] ligase family protein [Spirochaetaceae bacterium]|jgi:BirA family biotin operon repressor/biotin-[acetyl-CoA-carboxylase] ligase|nr:biotin--[acetyl-CoA-carboxylase] ligase family protein [Spirochaetaceae bacterium]